MRMEARDLMINAVSTSDPGETVLGGEFTIAAGGKGANQAVAAALRLRTHFCRQRR